MVTADGGFGLLAGHCAGPKLIAEDTLVARHRRFRLCPLAVVGVPLPTQAPLLGDGLEVAVPLSGGGLVGAVSAAALTTAVARGGITTLAPASQSVRHRRRHRP